MSDFEILLAWAKQFHDAKDIADVLDILRDIEQLDVCYQRGDQIAIAKFVNTVVSKHQAEANEHDKGRAPAQDIHQLYCSCRNFLVGLGMDRVKNKAIEKFTEEAQNHLGGN